MKLILAIALGGAVGACLRHFFSAAALAVTGPGFPWGIFAANILGSFLMGICVATFAHIEPVSMEVKAFLTIGILGAFTTFSTFSLDSVTLIERGEYLQASAYMIGSVILSVGGLFAGMALVRTVVS